MSDAATKNDAPGEVECLDPAGLEFRPAGARLELKRAGETEWRRAEAFRLFPLTEPDRWIAVVDADDKEVGILRDLRDLVAGSGDAVRAELRRRYMVPEIRRIVSCRDRFDLSEWVVETDRGRLRFITRAPHVHSLDTWPNRLTLTDVEGNRYMVPDVTALDPESRRHLEERR